MICNKVVMSSQDGEVTVDEFKKAIQKNCMGKTYGDFPKAFKSFIEGLFRTVDIDGICKERKRERPRRLSSLTIQDRLLPPTCFNENDAPYVSRNHVKASTA